MRKSEPTISAEPRTTLRFQHKTVLIPVIHHIQRIPRSPTTQTKRREHRQHSPHEHGQWSSNAVVHRRTKKMQDVPTFSPIQFLQLGLFCGRGGGRRIRMGVSSVATRKEGRSSCIVAQWLCISVAIGGDSQQFVGKQVHEQGYPPCFPEGQRVGCRSTWALTFTWHGSSRRRRRRRPFAPLGAFGVAPVIWA